MVPALEALYENWPFWLSFVMPEMELMLRMEPGSGHVDLVDPGPVVEGLIVHHGLTDLGGRALGLAVGAVVDLAHVS
jgi:hypothetical protein